jgi:hypothetical protein
MQGSVRAIFGQEEGMSIEDPKRRLIWHGMFLFLLGLLTGFVEPQFQKRAHGAGRSSRRRDERYFHRRTGRDMERVEVLSATERCGILDGALWDLRQLGGNRRRRGVRDRCPFAHHVSRTARPALAREHNHRSLYERWGRNYHLRGPRTLGRAPLYTSYALMKDSGATSKFPPRLSMLIQRDFNDCPVKLVGTGG